MGKENNIIRQGKDCELTKSRRNDFERIEGGETVSVRIRNKAQRVGK